MNVDAHAAPACHDVRMKFSSFCLTLSLSLYAHSSFADSQEEPAFCKPEHFSHYEIRSPGEQPKRLRLFSIGKVVLAGMAVGDSELDDVEDLAYQYSNATAAEGRCTWYLGKYNSEARKAFNNRPLPIPHGLLGTDAFFARKFDKTMSSSFHDDPTSFLSCAREEGYIGVGCEGQRHRGPSVFAMILSYAGCSPESSTKIVNSIWGTNGVRPSTRRAIARKAQLFAQENPRESAEMRALFEGR